MISIQTRDITDELARLVKRIDSLVDDPADNAQTKKAFVVLLTDDPEEAQPRLEQLAESRKLKNIPLTIFDGLRGPPGYRIARMAEVTVMMWKDNRVEINRAFAAGQLDDSAVNKVVADAKQFFVSKVPGTASSHDVTTP